MVQLNKFGNYKRELSLDAINYRFDLHQKIHDFEIEQLFPGWEFSEIQMRYLEKGIQYQGIYDIETSDFNPLGNFIIGYVFHKRDIVSGRSTKYSDHITKKDIHKAIKKDTFHFDYRLLQTLSGHINECHQIVGHYSAKFDTPFFRTRCMLTKQDHLIPDYGRVLQADTWRQMKTTMKAPRNTLRNLALYTGIDDKKTFVEMEHWKRIYFPSSPKWIPSMNFIMKHCADDVVMTEKALKKTEKFNPISMVRT